MRYAALLIVIICTAFISFGYPTQSTQAINDYQMLLSKYPQVRDTPYIWVDISEQRLYVKQRAQTLLSYPISTSKYGIGSTQNSYKTPLGIHHVEQKIGSGAPIGTIFKYRQNTNRIAQNLLSETADLITSRILHLKGLEHGANQGPGIDSYRRCIYIHGTAQESKIGSPASNGCIRLKNIDMIDLFNCIPIYTLVYISQ